MKRLLFAERTMLLWAWLAIAIVFTVWLPESFGTVRNFQIMFGSQAVLLILTLGLTLSLAAGEFDLSVAAVMAFAAQLVAVLNVDQGWPIWIAVAAALLAGAAIGLVNAGLIVGVGISSIVVTLGMATLLSGLRQLITGNRVISGVSDALTTVVGTRVFGLRLVFFYAVALTAIVWYVLEHTPTGRRLYFVGAGRGVARLSGIEVKAFRRGALVTTSLLSAVAGVALLGILGASTPETGTTFLLPAFASAFLGATAVVPGRFNAWGAFIAVYFLVTGFSGLQLAGFDAWVQDAFYGASLLTAVALAKLASKRHSHEEAMERGNTT